MSGVNRQKQAHIVSTAIRSPGPARFPAEVGGAPCFSKTMGFSIDPQPASISQTINISIVFICVFLVDYGRSICHSAIKNVIMLARVGTSDESVLTVAGALPGHSLQWEYLSSPGTYYTFGRIARNSAFGFGHSAYTSHM